MLALPNACALASEGEGDLFAEVDDPDDDAGVTLATGGGAGAGNEEGGSGGGAGSGGRTGSGGSTGAGGSSESGGAEGSGGTEASGGSDGFGGDWFGFGGGWFGFGGDWFGSGGSSSGDCSDLRSWEPDAEMNIEQGEEIEHNGTRYRATQFIYWTNAECAPDNPVEWCAGWFEEVGPC